jgi:mono/diheme cytochrome c family protein
VRITIRRHTSSPPELVGAKNYAATAFRRDVKLFPVRETQDVQIIGGLMSNNVMIAVLATLALCVAQATYAQDAASIERGTKVYTDQKCSVCHSIAGKGNPKGVLDDVGSRLTAEEIRMWIVNPVEMTKKTNAARKPQMRAYPNLAKEDLDGLVAYMMSLKKNVKK